MEDKFKRTIVMWYGSQRAMAAALDITTQTIQNWINENPKGMWSHAQKISQDCNVTYSEIMDLIIHHERVLDI